MKIKVTYIILLLTVSHLAQTQDLPSSLKIHFLYGSKPSREYKATEQKWFGGKKGGHVGIQSDTTQVLSFVPQGKLHWFAHRRKRHSRYAYHSIEVFWNLLGKVDSPKTATVVIPITPIQHHAFDSIADTYIKTSPYDYAFFGKRCASGTYEILATLGIARKYASRATTLKIFYPKRLRRKIFRLAKERNWEVSRTDGSRKRKWEND